ncbi:cysteine peptidase family C39 domain-containing protein [Tannerella forsythia]|uniref:Peptidase C39 domain-containing protein n=1 Tax=Tannerella forsythia TaxID=28112 RepID=A0A3P1YW58_TANFO|nr:hypothetical protein EII41_08095 [Tannerella forsythia]
MRLKFVKRKDAMDCGSAYLAMIIKLYSRNPNHEKICEYCALSKEGRDWASVS